MPLVEDHLLTEANKQFLMNVVRMMKSGINATSQEGMRLFIQYFEAMKELA